MPQPYREIHQIGADTRERFVTPDEVPAMRRLGVSLIGLTDAATPYAFVRHRPGMGQVVAVVGGEGEVLVDGAWRRLGAGWAFVTPVGAIHGYRALPRARWRLAWMMYAAPAPGRRAAAPGTAVRAFRADGWSLATAIEGLHRARRRPDEAELWLALAEHAARRLARAEVRSRLEPVWRAVESDPARAWTLGDLAAIAGVGPERLRRLSQAETGRPPLRQVAWLRHQRAIALLRVTDLKAAAIGREVGFTTAAAFSAACRRVTGRTPSAHRAG